MVGISKGMVGVAALVAFGLVSLDDMAKGWATQAQFAQRAPESINHESEAPERALRERALETLRTLAAQQQASRPAAKAAASPECLRQSWPYYSSDCLVYSDGTPVAPAVRVVRVDVRADATVQMARLR